LPQPAANTATVTPSAVPNRIRAINPRTRHHARTQKRKTTEGAHPDNASTWNGAATSSSPWEKAGEGNEDVAAPFGLRAVSRCPWSRRTAEKELARGDHEEEKGL
jgi:hypothetical protein